MKKRIYSLLLLGLMAFTMLAQDMTLPVDPKVRTGKLDNGLTYFIRQNAHPKERADFYIAQKVGSVLEEDSQRGLAHFLEHMAFNGTKNLPEKTMLNYMESVGVKFGENVNAYTGWDETVYTLMNVPTVREGIIDTALLTLHDWSSFISLEHDEIDKERGVIHEEWRSRSSAQMRIWEQTFPIIFQNNQYAHRFPIGIMDVVDNFEYQELKDYYHKWYRPDLQAVIVVGDIDVDQVESKIKQLFSDIPAPVNPAERIYYPISDNVEPIVAIGTDPEAQYSSIALYYKHDPIPAEQKNTISYYAYYYMVSLANTMLNARLQEITHKPNSPFLYAYVSDGDFLVAKTKDAWSATTVVKEGGIKEGLQAIIRENERAKQFGFTASEYERAKANFLKRVEVEYNNRETQKNEVYTEAYVDCFIDGEPIPGIETEYMLFNQISGMIPVEAINELVQQLIGDKNLVVSVSGPQKDGLSYPSREELLQLIKATEAEEITAYVDAVSDEPLISKEPKAGSIKSTKNLPEFEAVEWTLSNGAKVIIKPTKFKEDEVRMEAISWGGMSVLSNKDVPTLKMLNELWGLGGVGNFSATDLPKVLAGKRASVRPGIGRTTEVMSGSCAPNDFETLLQLTYLYFTQPRTDTEAYEAFYNRNKTMLEAQEANPMTTFIDSMYSAIYNNNPRQTRTTAADMDKIDYLRAMEIYKDRFSDIQNFTFTFVGNVDPEVIRPYIVQYIGGIAPTKRKETWKDDGVFTPKTNATIEYNKKMEVPMSTVLLFYSGDTKNTYENEIFLQTLTDILDIVYTEKIREDEGGTYGVTVYSNLFKYPKEEFAMQIMFQTNVEVKDKLIKIAIDELNNIAENGPRAADVNKVKENLIKKHSENLHENGYWQNVLKNNILYNVNRVKDYELLINKITVSSMQQFTKNLLKDAYKKEVIQNPQQ